MIDKTDLQTLSPVERARVIYSTAQSELAARLWQAALGNTDRGDGADPARPQSSLEALLASVTAPDASPKGIAHVEMPSHHNSAPHVQAVVALPQAQATIPAATIAVVASDSAPLPQAASARPVSSNADGLGPNERYRASLCDAARHSGVPATALASIIDAEAAKRRDGSWNTNSRNPRSSAAGLGQFLGKTWEGLAESRGTWLHEVASASGWLTETGKVRAEARGSLLALRYDANASIRGIADFARQNLDRLESRGVKTNDSVTTTARAAYLSHHLGFGDAMKFLKGGIQGDRARTLLHAQVGGVDAERRIAQAGDPSRAHQKWLLAYIDSRVQPQRFAI